MKVYQSTIIWEQQILKKKCSSNPKENPRNEKSEYPLLKLNLHPFLSFMKKSAYLLVTQNMD